MPNLKQTLSELLTHKDQTIYRNAMSIVKRLQRLEKDGTQEAIDKELEQTDTVRCNNCMTIYPTEVETCTKCGTDAYLMDNYIN